MRLNRTKWHSDAMSRRQILQASALAGTGLLSGDSALCNDERQMQIGESKNGTYQITWDKGELEVNLTPANHRLPPDHLPATVYSRPRFDGGMIYVHDNVGITSLKLAGCPADPRICWDNREHHFWKGFNGAFRPRNAIVNDIKITQDKSSTTLSFYYIADLIRTTIAWTFHNGRPGEFIRWDTTFTFQNLNSFAVEDYMALFACYHQPGRNFYWAPNDRLEECPENFVAYPNEESARIETGNMRAFADLLSGESKKHNKSAPAGLESRPKNFVAYGKPVLLSSKTDWYGNGRHIVMVEPGKCLSINSARSQARDWVLSPGRKLLQPMESFSARVRHIIGEVNEVPDLQRKWDEFA